MALPVVVGIFFLHVGYLGVMCGVGVILGVYPLDHVVLLCHASYMDTLTVVRRPADKLAADMRECFPTATLAQGFTTVDARGHHLTGAVLHGREWMATVNADACPCLPSFYWEVTTDAERVHGTGPAVIDVIDRAEAGLPLASPAPHWAELVGDDGEKYFFRTPADLSLYLRVLAISRGDSNFSRVVSAWVDSGDDSLLGLLGVAVNSAAMPYGGA